MGLVILTLFVLDGFDCGSKLLVNTQSWLDCSMNGGIEFWPSQRDNRSNSQHIVDLTLASLYTLGRFSLSLTYAAFDMGQLSLVLSLWVAVDDFCSRRLQTTSNNLKSATKAKEHVLEVPGIQDVVSSLQDIHSYSDLINKELCNRMAFYLLATSFFYPLNFSDIISPEVWYNSISLFIINSRQFILLLCVLYLLSLLMLSPKSRMQRKKY